MVFCDVTMGPRKLGPRIRWGPFTHFVGGHIYVFIMKETCFTGIFTFQETCLIMIELNTETLVDLYDSNYF